MMLWARSRAAWVVVVTAVAAGVLSGAFPAVTVPIPDLRHGGASLVPLPILLALAPAVAVAYSVSRRWRAYEIRNRRGVWWLDVGLGLLGPLAVAVAAVASGHGPGQVVLLGAARTQASLVGVTLTAAVLLPAAWTSVPALAWAIVSLVLGPAPGAGWAWWAWPANAVEQRLVFWAAALLALGAGALLYGTQHHPGPWDIPPD